MWKFKIDLCGFEQWAERIELLNKIGTLKSARILMYHIGCSFGELRVCKICFSLAPKSCNSIHWAMKFIASKSFEYSCSLQQDHQLFFSKFFWFLKRSIIFFSESESRFQIRIARINKFAVTYTMQSTVLMRLVLWSVGAFNTMSRSCISSIWLRILFSMSGKIKLSCWRK